MSYPHLDNSCSLLMPSPALAFGRVSLWHDFQSWLCPQVDWPGPHWSGAVGGGEEEEGEEMVELNV